MNKDKIKEEWEEESWDLRFSLNGEDFYDGHDMGKVADWWLKKLDEAIKEHNELIIEKIKELEDKEYDKHARICATGECCFTGFDNLINNLKIKI